jgi:hypothetical protein
VKAVVVLGAAMLAAPLAAEPSELSIRVADEQSTILARADTRYLRGEGDLLFVHGRDGQWYQVEVNEGCLSPVGEIKSLNFGNLAAMGRIDRFTKVLVSPKIGMGRSCLIDSIRRVEIEPQSGWETLATLD